MAMPTQMAGCRVFGLFISVIIIICWIIIFVSMEKILVFTATYNEADSVESLVTDVFEYLPESDVLVVDDASPDGTGRI